MFYKLKNKAWFRFLFLFHPYHRISDRKISCNFFIRWKMIKQFPCIEPRSLPNHVCSEHKEGMCHRPSFVFKLSAPRIPHLDFGFPRTPYLFKLFHIFQKCLRTLIQVLNRSASLKHFAHFVSNISLVSDFLKGTYKGLIIQEPLAHRHRPHL